jgi:hypothetical protein
LALLTIYAELEQVICSGSRRGKEMTYSLLAQRAPKSARLSREEALAELTRRYFRSHGPATIRDFVWWSGLTTADAKRGIEIVRGENKVVDGLTYWTVPDTMAGRTKNGRIHLLPIYDEYVVAYRDLLAVPRDTASRGVLPQPLVVDGGMAGTWKVVRTGEGSVIEVKVRRRLDAEERRALTQVLKRYGNFHGVPVTCRGGL